MMILRGKGGEEKGLDHSHGLSELMICPMLEYTQEKDQHSVRRDLTNSDIRMEVKRTGGVAFE